QRLSRVREELRARGLSAEVIHLENRARPGWVAVKISSPVSERNGGPAQ
ncbi:MAG TPA: cell division protein FtsQ, partial [Archangium sp.]|nr:cell division protein FtsQ [Archangium sp.]